MRLTHINCHWLVPLGCSQIFDQRSFRGHFRSNTIFDQDTFKMLLLQRTAQQCDLHISFRGHFHSVNEILWNALGWTHNDRFWPILKTIFISNDHLLKWSNIISKVFQRSKMWISQKMLLLLQIRLHSLCELHMLSVINKCPSGFHTFLIRDQKWVGLHVWLRLWSKSGSVFCEHSIPSFGLFLFPSYQFIFLLIQSQQHIHHKMSELQL